MDDWLKIYLPKIRMRSKHTIDAYESSLSLYLDFLEDKKGITCKSFSEECFRREWIEEWIASSNNERKNSRRTCDLRLSCIKSLLKYLASKNAIYLQYHLDVCCIGKLSVGHGKQVDGLSKKAMKELFVVMQGNTKTELRDRTFFTCMYDTGARAGEMLSIKISDLKLDNEMPYVTIIGKGNKLRTLLFSAQTVMLLKRYLKEMHGLYPNPNHYLFYSRVKGQDYPLDLDTINVNLKLYAKKAHSNCPEIPLTLHTHQIRHSSCTHWFQDGVNLAQISKYLGHESIETTRIYLGISKEELIEALHKRDNGTITENSKYGNINGGLRSLIKCRKDN